jgi:hypothetical protein
MLDRVSLGQPLVELHPLRRISSQNGRRSLPSGREARQKLTLLTARFRNALKRSIEGIIEAGRVLIEAKNELEHGQFSDWVVRELRFGTRKDGNREPDLRKAEMLMFLARNEVISNPCHWHAFPSSSRTLWELTQIRPKQRLLELIANGTINSGMTREEAVALRHKTSQERSPTPKLRREIAALLEVCIILGGGDGVLAHIRDLNDVSSVPPAKDFYRAARWVRQKLAKRRQTE